MLLDYGKIVASLFGYFEGKERIYKQKALIKERKKKIAVKFYYSQNWIMANIMLLCLLFILQLLSTNKHTSV